MKISSLSFLLSLISVSSIFAADDFYFSDDDTPKISTPSPSTRRLTHKEQALDDTMTELVSILGRKEELQGLKASKPQMQREIKTIKELLGTYNQKAFQENYISHDLFTRAKDLISSFEKKEHLKGIFSLIQELHTAHLTKIESN